MSKGHGCSAMPLQGGMTHALQTKRFVAENLPKQFSAGEWLVMLHKPSNRLGRGTTLPFSYPFGS